MIQQIEISLSSKSRGFHLVTSEIMRQLRKLPKTSIINIFCKHTSCGLSINENANPDAVVIPLGYAADEIKPKNRKTIEEILR